MEGCVNKVDNGNLENETDMSIENTKKGIGKFPYITYPDMMD